jgi:hypothetical protein
MGEEFLKTIFLARWFILHQRVVLQDIVNILVTSA